MDKKQPRFSFVMPTYNRSYWIAHAINSVMEQTVRDWELIIVDDGSTDNTERVVKSYESPRIHYFKIPHTGHISAVRNYGNKRAVGEWIVVQDSDDMSMPDRLEHIKNCIELYEGAQEPVDVIYHDMYVRSRDGEHGGNAEMRHIRKIGEFVKEDLLTEQYIPGQVAYKREVILKYPYDERITVSDDFQMLIELALNDCVFRYIDRPLYEYIVLNDSVNVAGELDGRRFEDTRIIVSILKEKYNIAAVGELKKWETLTGKVLKREYVQ